MILPITSTLNTVAKNFHYFKSKGCVIVFPADQSERPPGLSTNEIEAVSQRLIRAEFQPAQAQATWQARKNLAFQIGIESENSWQLCLVFM